MAMRVLLRCTRSIGPISRRFMNRRAFSTTATSVYPRGPLRILEYPNPALRSANQDVTVFGPELENLTNELFRLMYEDDGAGLAAPQAGVNYKLMVFNTSPTEDESEECVLANPVITSRSDETEFDAEGCLSFPGVEAEIERSVSVTVEAQDVSGDGFQLTLDGFPARVFLHEYDHLEGKLFVDRMDYEELFSNKFPLETLERKYIAGVRAAGGDPSHVESVHSRLFPEEDSD